MERIGHEVRIIGADLRAAPDSAILHAAEKDNRILVTLDKDFGDLVFVAALLPPPGIVLIRIDPAEIATRLDAIATAINSAAAPGLFVVIGTDSVRTRPLPMH